VVVDNASTDGTVSFLREQGYQVLLTKGSAVRHPMNGMRAKYDEYETTFKNKDYYQHKWGTYQEIVRCSPGLSMNLSGYNSCK
jgi:hypothetical protein